jgi:hypothetical protein
MLKVMEFEVYVEKDFLRRNLKVWVESLGENADDRLNWFFKDGELVHEVRKIQHVMPEGFTPMFSGPMTMMKEVIEKINEAYPSSLFVKIDEYDRLNQKNQELMRLKDAEIKKWEQRFDKALDVALENGRPIVATLEHTEDTSASHSNQEKSDRPRPIADVPNGLVDTFSFGLRDGLQMFFGAFFAFGIIVAIGKAFRWW